MGELNRDPLGEMECILAADSVERRLPPRWMGMGFEPPVLIPPLPPLPCSLLLPSPPSCSCVSTCARCDRGAVAVKGVGVVMCVSICRPASRGVRGVADEGVRMCTRGTLAVSVSMAGKTAFWAAAVALLLADLACRPEPDRSRLSVSVSSVAAAVVSGGWSWRGLAPPASSSCESADGAVDSRPPLILLEEGGGRKGGRAGKREPRWWTRTLLGCC